jgi:hypothetical protein
VEDTESGRTPSAAELNGSAVAVDGDLTGDGGQAVVAVGREWAIREGVSATSRFW